MVNRILEIDEGLPIREIGLYSLGYSWVNNDRSGVAFLDYIYQVDDEQFGIMFENMHNFDFDDFEQSWSGSIIMIQKDYLLIMSMNFEKAIQSGDSEAIDRVHIASELKNLLLK